MANKNAIKSDRTTVTEYPVEETSRAIRKEDWNRIKRLVGNIRPEPKFLRTVYSMSFGVAVTAVFTIISIYDIPQKSSWILPFYICSAVFALALAIIFFCVDKSNITSKSADLGSLRKDMQEIEDTFKRETGEEGISSSQSELEIIEAVYGTNKIGMNVTEQLRRHVIDNTLTLQVTNLFFGNDPDKGNTKKLIVKYNFAGKPYEKTVIETQGIYLP